MSDTTQQKQPTLGDVIQKFDVQLSRDMMKMQEQFENLDSYRKTLMLIVQNYEQIVAKLNDELGKLKGPEPAPKLIDEIMPKSDEITVNGTFTP